MNQLSLLDIAHDTTPEKLDPQVEVHPDAQPEQKQEKPLTPKAEHTLSALDLSSLNEAQREAVTTIDGPVLIIAGPGTGKTTVLTNRIAYILQTTDTKPESILAMTFTDPGVHSMKSKLLKIIGPDAYKVNITTIHGFCNALIQDYPDYFTDVQGFSPLSDLEKIQFTREILEDPVFSDLTPAGKPDTYLLKLPSVLSTMKREYITPSKLQQAIEAEQTILESMNKYVTRGPEKGKKLTGDYQTQERKIRKWKELLIFYEKYQQMLRERKRYDYDDMIVFALDKLTTDPELLSTVQEKYLYFLVDEYQDTNDAQNKLLFTLAEYWGEDANFFAVGDDDQAIYRFQGASVKNITDFLDVFPNAKIITLKENYRSHQGILDTSREFIRHNSSSIEHKLSSINKELASKAEIPRQTIKKASFHSYIAETMYILDEIESLHKQGVEYEKIAILTRENKDVDDIADMLQRRKIPFIRKTGNDVLQNKYVKQLLNMLKIIAEIEKSPNNDQLLYTVLHYPYFDLPKADLIKLARHVSAKWTVNMWDYILGNDPNDPWSAAGISPEGEVQIRAVLNKFTEWAGKAHIVTLVKLLEKVINESGLLDHIISLPAKFQELNMVNSFFNEAKVLNSSKPDLTLWEFLDTLQIMQEYRIPIKEQDMGLSKGGVTLGTAHSSKGLEYDAVFIAKLYTKKWDNKRVPDILPLPTVFGETEKSDQLEEERRLFYVALTRARKDLYLTLAKVYESSYSGKATEVSPSQFLSELPETDIQEIDTETYQQSVNGQIEELLKVNPYEHVYINTVEEKHILQNILQRYRLSPTSFNTYLVCPMEFLMNVVLRTPRATSQALEYGNAYHKALEVFYMSKMKTGTNISKEQFVEVFNLALEKALLTSSQVTKLKKKGRANLGLYYDEIANKEVSPIKLEHSLRSIYLGGAALSGRIDRVDYVDRTRKWVSLCDYKTGGAITQNDLLRTPTRELDSHDKGQRYYNQLMFYKVATDLDPYLTSFGASAVQGKLLFVDPDKEVFTECVVEYEQSQVEEMKALIIDVWRDIQALKFPRLHVKNGDTCEYCQLGIH
ncbi:MAG: ATP-dependent DNA helicase [Candidatus Dojkabacteria bacterium]|nr:MAG: ATP-dependent DNA helicase [Candidatus Dojkabacteria bacterium]